MLYKLGTNWNSLQGVEVLIDVETYEYFSVHSSGSEGVLVLIQHYRDIPLMRKESFVLAPGTEADVGLSITEIITTQVHSCLTGSECPTYLWEVGQKIRLISNKRWTLVKTNEQVLKHNWEMGILSLNFGTKRLETNSMKIVRIAKILLVAMVIISVTSVVEFWGGGSTGSIF